MPKRTIADMTGRELVKKLDAEFSLYVRLKEADDCGYVTCPTCGVTHPYNSGDIHCSHFYGRANHNVRWDERNVIAQCARENTWDEGNKPEMAEVLLKKWGAKELAQMRALSKMPNKRPDDEWLRMMIAEYRSKIKALREEKGLK